jgi:hypothetical protein
LEGNSFDKGHTVNPPDDMANLEDSIHKDNQEDYSAINKNLKWREETIEKKSI